MRSSVGDMGQSVGDSGGGDNGTVTSPVTIVNIGEETTIGLTSSDLVSMCQAVNCNRSIPEQECRVQPLSCHSRHDGDQHRPGPQQRW